MNEEFYIEYIRKDLLGTLEESEKQSLKSWKDENKENQDLAERLYKAWDISEQFGSDIDIDTNADYAKIFKKINASESGRIKLISFKPLLAIAASLLMAVSIYFLMKKERHTFVESNYDGYVVVLPDMSKAVLSKGSTLTYLTDFEDKREVKLQGQGYFDVETNPGRSFKVLSPHLETTVTGTTFYISDSKDDPNSSVQLIEGRVSVSQIGEIESTILNPGERVELSRESMVKKSRLDLTDFDWHASRLTFEREELSKVVTSIKSYYDIKIKIDPVLENCTFTGNFKNQPAEEMINSIAVLYNGELRISGDLYIIEGGTCK